ncbi:MAG: MFS transporter [Alphaproteobacteria bacterium]|nr:MFS transporter [Alphaproteobacteria bacterium]
MTSENSTSGEVREPHILRAAAILAASSLTLFAMAGVSPALPAIARAYSDIAGIELLAPMVLTITAIAIAVTAPFAGLVIDKFGRKPVLVCALLLYLVAGLAPVWLDSLPAILASRALLGIAAGSILTVSTTLIGDFYEGAARNRMAGVQFACMGLAMAVGTAVAGILADIGWHLPFYMYAVAVLVLPLAWFGVREPRISRAETVESMTVDVARDIPVAGIALIYALVLAGMMSTFLVPSQMPFLLPEIGVPEAWIAGFAIALFNLVTAGTATAFRWLRARLDNRALLAGSFFFLGSGLLLAATATGPGQALVGMLIAGIGFGPLMPTLNAWLLSLAPVTVRGRLVGGLTFCQFLGFFLSPFFVHPVAERLDMTGAFAITGLGQLALALVFAGTLVSAFLAGRLKGAP